MTDHRFETLCLHAGQIIADKGARFLTVRSIFGSIENAADLDGALEAA